SADTADVVKHNGYAKWLEAQQCHCSEQLLLAVSGEQDEYEGFPLLTWQALCVEMRHLALQRCRDDQLNAAAIILGFVGAVEQNLLGFSCTAIEGLLQN